MTTDKITKEKKTTDKIMTDSKMQAAMLNMTKKLVGIKSINTTEGETKIGCYLEDVFREMPYFQKHPEFVIIQELKNDVLKRRNVFALVIGEKKKCSDTLILHGHTDTVDIKDFKELEPYACDPDQLMEELKKIELELSVKEDLASGDYLFGRGTCDMKAGDAVWIEMIREISEHTEKLSGNLLVSFQPVEENLHTGIMEALDVFEMLKTTYGLSYKLAINNDFICPLYPGDSVKTVYTGTVGKLLPCFYIQGKETHVGQCFEGFDASAVAAGIVNKIHMNHRFCDSFEGEYTLPPSVLKMKDLKAWYNVQTAKEAFVYFNYFVHNASMTEIIAGLKGAAEEVLEETKKKIAEQAEYFCRVSMYPYKEPENNPLVLTFQELMDAAVEKTFSREEYERILNKAISENIDKREIPIDMIRYLLSAAGIYQPAVVLYFAAPYCPHNTMQEQEMELFHTLEKIVARTGDACKEEYRIKRFFPSLSDSSYLKIDDTQDSIDCLADNFPAMDILYPTPIDKIKALNVPAVNYGCYGKDAHKWTERVNTTYTFGTLPVLVYETIRTLLDYEG